MNDRMMPDLLPLDPTEAQGITCEWCGEPATEWDTRALQYCCRACALRIARNRLMDEEELLDAAGFLPWED